MTMKIPFDTAAIYSFLHSRSCTKTLPEGSLPWPASLMNHVFLFILTAFSLYTSLNLFTLPQNSLFTIWCELSESRSDVSRSSTVTHVPCPWGHTPFIYRFELNSELSDPQFCSTWFPTFFLPWPLSQWRITGVVSGESAQVCQDCNEWEGWGVEGNPGHELWAGCIWL